MTTTMAKTGSSLLFLSSAASILCAVVAHRIYRRLLGNIDEENR
jgi:hypothetical protein